jgi:hypothetical protein
VPVETYSVNSYLAFEHFVDRKQGLNGVLLVTIVHLDDRLYCMVTRPRQGNADSRIEISPRLSPLIVSKSKVERRY